MTMGSNVSSIPRVSADDVGSYWTRDDGSLWRIISFSEHPTVTWERLDGPMVERKTQERCRGVVGSLITAGFVRLVREDESGR
jgi:hypothetical protein